MWCESATAPHVETGPDWFCEGVWGGAFADHGLDQTDVVFGSGGVRRDDKLCFVSSASTLDRLVCIESHGTQYVSNSLPCLLNAVDATVDPTYLNYHPDFRTITSGIHRYKNTLNTTAGDVQLVYYRNIWLTESALEVVDKPYVQRDFSTFAHYEAFLKTAMNDLAENMRDGARKRPWEPIGTVSSGYDAATVAALAKQVGLRDVICFDRAGNGKLDDGSDVARELGLNRVLIPRDAWRAQDMPEVPFVAADSKGEDVYFSSAREHLAGKVLLTGFHGDKIWAKDTQDVSDEIVRGDQSGLSLTEFRLWIGFIHCPVCFLGVRQIRDIVQISNQADMQAWDVSGTYSRPICRRIVESAGGRRESFGQRKLAATVSFNVHESLTPESLEQYLAWVKSHLIARGAALPRSLLIFARLPRQARYALLAFVRAVTTSGVRGTPMLFTKWIGPINRAFFPWAIEKAKERYGKRESTVEDE